MIYLAINSISAINSQNLANWLKKYAFNNEINFYLIFIFSLLLQSANDVYPRHDIVVSFSGCSASYRQNYLKIIFSLKKNRY